MSLLDAVIWRRVRTLLAGGGGGGEGGGELVDGSVTTAKLAASAVTAAKIGANVITNSKLAQVATATFKGRSTGGTGDAEDLTTTLATALLNVFSSTLKGLVPASGGGALNFMRADGAWAVPATTIADNSVTFAQLADVGTDQLLGRDTAGTGDPEAITVGGGLEFSGGGGIQRSALTGAITAPAGSNATSVAANQIAVGNLQQIFPGLLGRATAALGNVEALTLGTGLEFFGVTLRRSALTGDIVCAAGSNATTFRTGAAASVVGRSFNTSGALADIAATVDGQVLRRSAGALGFGTIATAGIADGAITFAKIQTVSASFLLGRGSAGFGSLQEITIGTGLTLTGTTLAATAGDAPSLGSVLVTGSNTDGSNISVSHEDAIYFQGDEIDFEYATIEIEADGALAITAPAGSTSAGGPLKLRGGTAYFGADANVMIDRGNLDFQNAHAIINLPDPVTAQGAATKAYVDASAPADGSITLAKLADLATDCLIGRDTAATGVPESIAVGGGLEFTGAGSLRVSDAIPARGAENVAVDLIPSGQHQGTVNTAGNVTHDAAIPISRRLLVTADVWVEDAAGDVVYCKSIVCRVHRKATGDAILVSTSIIDDPLSTALFTFAASVSTTNVRFTLSNTSGTNRPYNLLIGSVSSDKP